jgi:hypothetical protein
MELVSAMIAPNTTLRVNDSTTLIRLSLFQGFHRATLVTHALIGPRRNAGF